MKKAKTLLSLFFALAFLGCQSLDKNLKNSEVNTITNFPLSWEGKWEGELLIYAGSKLKQKISMGLHILPIEGSTDFTFKIRYGEDKPESWRNYELIEVDNSTGHYKVDEKNTIMLDSYFVGGKFFQRFEVGGNMLFCTLEEEGSNLVWEIVSGKLSPVNTTGDSVFEEEEIPAVNSYPVSVFQKAILTKEKD